MAKYVEKSIFSHFVFHFSLQENNVKIKMYFPQIGKRKGKKYFVSRTLGREMEKFYPFPVEKFGKNQFLFPFPAGNGIPVQLCCMVLIIIYDLSLQIKDFLALTLL